MNKSILIFMIIIITGCVAVDEHAFSNVKREGGKVFIIDRTGYKWDVTRAESLGFSPEKFQYGIGKDTFVTLDDSLLDDAGDNIPEDFRVIGIEGDEDSKAYSVKKLSRHEISNSSLDGKPVAVGY
jgi:hypothetical protein